MYRLIIGDKAYSSWSLRGWLLLKAFGIPFRGRVVPMYDPAFDALKAEMAPAGTVPILEWEEDRRTLRIWDSAAIAETLAERHPESGIWPADPALRRLARVLVASMHAGFGGLRGTAPMNLHRVGRPLADPPPDLAADVTALGRLWTWAFETGGGPWLAGPAFSAADAFYAPVTFRLTGYALTDAATAAYCDRLQAHEAVRAWHAEAMADPRRIPLYDDIP